MADILDPTGGYDLNNPGSDPFSGLTTDTTGLGNGFGMDWTSVLNGLSGLFPNGLSDIMGLLGGALPALGTLASGGTLGTTNTNATNTGTNAFSGQTNTSQNQTFNNAVNQLLSGNTFQNQMQNQTGTTNTNQQMQGGFTQGQTGGFSQGQTGGFGQQQTGGFGQTGTGTTNLQITPQMMEEARQAGQMASGALQQLIPNAQNLWGLGSDYLTRALSGGPAIPMPTPDLIKQAFEPFVSSIADQAITAARNAGFAGGTDLLGGAASPLAGRALATVPGQEAAMLMQAQQQIPLLNAQILGQQVAAGNSVLNPLSQAIGQSIGLVSAYPTGQTQSGTNTNNVSGTNFGNVSGTNFGNASGTNFGNTSGTNFQDVNSTSLQNLMNAINSQGGFNQTGATTQTGSQQNTGQTTQQGTGTATNTGNTTVTQSLPIPSLVGSAIGGGLTGLAGSQAAASAAGQNQAFLNLLGGLAGGLSSPWG